MAQAGVGRLQQTDQAPAFTAQWQDREWVGQWWACAPGASERSLWGLETRSVLTQNVSDLLGGQGLVLRHGQAH